MENFFNNDEILKDLYEVRCEKFAQQYIEKYGDSDDLEEANKEERKLENILREKIKNKKDIEIIMSQFEKIQYANMRVHSFWFDKFYKVGFADGISFKNEIEKI